MSRSKESSCFFLADSTRRAKSGLRLAQVLIVEGLTPTNAPAFSKVNPDPHADMISSANSLVKISRPFFAFSIGAVESAADSSICKNYHIPGRKKVLT
jgi:hypothetical protein